MPRVRVLLERPSTSNGTRDPVTQLRNAVAQLLDKHSEDMKEVAYKEIYELLHDSTKASDDLIWVRATIAVPSISSVDETPVAFIRSVTVQLNVTASAFSRTAEAMKRPTLAPMHDLLSCSEFKRQCSIDTLLSNSGYEFWRLTSLTCI